MFSSAASNSSHSQHYTPLFNVGNREIYRYNRLNCPDLSSDEAREILAHPPSDPVRRENLATLDRVIAYVARFHFTSLPQWMNISATTLRATFLFSHIEGLWNEFQSSNLELNPSLFQELIRYRDEEGQNILHHICQWEDPRKLDLIFYFLHAEQNETKDCHGLIDDGDDDTPKSLGEDDLGQFPLDLLTTPDQQPFIDQALEIYRDQPSYLFLSHLMKLKDLTLAKLWVQHRADSLLAIEFNSLETLGSEGRLASRNLDQLSPLFILRDRKILGQEFQTFLDAWNNQQMSERLGIKSEVFRVLFRRFDQSDAERIKTAHQLLDYYSNLMPIVQKFGSEEIRQQLIEELYLFLIQQKTNDRHYVSLLLAYIRDCGLDHRDIPNQLQEVCRKIETREIHILSHHWRNKGILLSFQSDISTFSPERLIVLIELILPNEFFDKVTLFNECIPYLSPQLCDFILSHGITILRSEFWHEGIEDQIKNWLDKGGMCAPIFNDYLSQVTGLSWYKHPSPKIRHAYVSKQNITVGEQQRKLRKLFDEQGCLIDSYAAYVTTHNTLDAKKFQGMMRHLKRENVEVFEEIIRENRSNITLEGGELRMCSTLENDKIIIKYKDIKDNTLYEIGIYLKKDRWRSIYDLLQKALFPHYENFPLVHSPYYTLNHKGVTLYDSYFGYLKKTDVEVWPYINDGNNSSVQPLRFFDEATYTQVRAFFDRYSAEALIPFHRTLAEMFPESGGDPSNLTVHPDPSTQEVQSIYEWVHRYTALYVDRKALYEHLQKELSEELDHLKDQEKELKKQLNRARNYGKVKRSNRSDNASSLSAET